MSERATLEQAIAALEAQRAVLGDAMLELALAPLRAQLAALETAPTPAMLRGERKFITVMFADLAGFTTLAETLDPEAARDLMNACFDRLVPVIHSYEGTVDKFIGDGVMAIFGAPRAHENDPERALRAALAMQTALEAFNAECGLDLALHFGINTGHVVAGGLGAYDHREYSVMGDAVNVAARLEALSQRGEILVGPTTYRFTAPLFEFDALSPALLKGKSEPLPVYRLRAVKAERGSLRGLVGMNAPLVGRDAPYAALQHALTALQAGRGSVLTLVGEAGLGKSRLLAEARRAAPEGVLWLEGRCLSFGASIAYWPWLDILRAFAGVTPDATPAELHDALRARVDAVCGAHSTTVFPYLGRLLSLPLAAEAAARVHGLDGQTLQSATFRAIETLFTCLTAQQPVVIVAEDLHWADPTSLALLERLFPLTGDAPLTLIGVLRPEREHGCWRFHERAAQACAGRHTALLLEPLDAEESAELVSHLLRVEALPPTLREKILRHAEGNPFYVEEIIRSLLDMQAIALDEATGAWRATRDVAAIELPDTLQGVLMARIDRLQQETKHILRLAAVIGRAFLYRVLAELAHEERALDARLGDLVQGQLIRERARDPELEYIFKHQLTQEAAYNGLLIQERRGYHRQVAEATEYLFPDRADELAGVLAYHWEQAGDAARALPALRRAGQLATAQFANLEAIDYFTRALALAPATDLETRYDLITARELCYDTIGPREAQWQDLESLTALARAADNAAWLAYVLVRQANWHWQVSDYTQAIAAAQEAIRLGEAHGLSDPLGRGYYTWGQVLMYQRQYETAQAILEKALPFSRAAGMRWLEGMILRNIGNVLWFQGRNDESEPYIVQALEIHRAINDRRSEAAALNTLGLILQNRRDFENGLRIHEEALHIFEEIGASFGMWMMHTNFEIYYEGLYDYPRARQEAEQGIRAAQRAGNRAGELSLRMSLAEMDFSEGKLEAVAVAYTELLAQARALDLTSDMARLTADIGWLLVERGDYAAAQQLFEEALALRQQTQEVAQLIGAQYNLTHLRFICGQYAAAEAECQGYWTELQRQNPTDNSWQLHQLAQIAYQRGVYPLARERAQQALELARQWQNRGGQSMYLTTLGHILAAQGQAAEAETAYREALEARRDLTWQPHRALEIRAGLARLVLARGDLAAAQAELADALPVLLEGFPLFVKDPFAIYLTAYHVLAAVGDPRAAELLARANTLLQERAATIEDESLRRSYLEAVPSHRELVMLAGG